MGIIYIKINQFFKLIIIQLKNGWNMLLIITIRAESFVYLIWNKTIFVEKYWFCFFFCLFINTKFF